MRASYSPARPLASIFVRSLALLALMAPVLTSCTGSVGGDPAGGGDPGGGPGPGPGPGGMLPGVKGDPNAAGVLPLQRLTNREYSNTVRDLLGDTSQPGSQFPADRDPSVVFRRAGDVAVQDATVLRTAAESMAAIAVRNIKTLVTCDPATGDDACARQFISTFGQRAFRRPLATDESEKLFTLYSNARTMLTLPFSEAIGVVVEGMLQSWQFLYHWEAAAGEPVVREGTVMRLGPYQTASRLSYFLWGSMPDDVLLAAAAAGTLNTPAGLQAQARRLLGDPKAKDTVARFFVDWLELDTLSQVNKSQTAYPDWTTELQTAMADETAAFVQNVVFSGDGSLATLLGAPYSFVNQSLGKVYGTSVSGTALQRADLNGAQRAGFLTEPGFLASNGSSDGSNPVKRGKAIYTKLLCHELPPPPPDVPAPKPASAGGTTRQRFEEHDRNACAQACHGAMDPIGFAFENFDGIGHWRTTDNGMPVDSSGAVLLDGTMRSFSNAVELAQHLAGSAEVRDCFSAQWLRFALARLESPADLASLQTAAQLFSAGGGKVQDLMVALATARSFRYRSLSPGEVMP